MKNEHTPSKKCLDMVGEMIQLDGDWVTCVGAEATASTIETAGDGYEYPGVRFYVRYPNGKYLWTVTFPDRWAGRVAEGDS